MSHKRTVYQVLAVLAFIATVVAALIVSTNNNNSSQAQPVTFTSGWQSDFVQGYERTLGDLPVDQAFTLVNNAEILCEYMNVEHTIPQAFDYGVDSLGMSSDQTAVVIEAAIRTHCPQYEAELQREVS